jgi:hypothetical protein
VACSHGFDKLISKQWAKMGQGGQGFVSLLPSTNFCENSFDFCVFLSFGWSMFDLFKKSTSLNLYQISKMMNPFKKIHQNP